MTFAKAFLRTYTTAWRFLIALPLLGLAIIGVEGWQHVLEWRAGMFISGARAHYAANDIGRMVSGSIKVLWLNVVGFWVFRFVVSGSPGVTMWPGLEAVRRYALVMIFVTALGAITLWPPALAPASAQRPLSFVMLAVMLATFPLGAVLTPWIVGSALGDPRATIGLSIRRALGSIWWGVALSLATELPLMAIHYALNPGAIGRASPVAALMLAADAMFVGYLGVTAATSQLMVAERMAERADDRLIVAA